MTERDAQPPDPLERAAERLLAEIDAMLAESRQSSVERATLDSALERDLGLDSLARVELLTRIEHAFAVTLPEQALVTAETPRDLLRLLRGAQPGHAHAIAHEVHSLAQHGAARAPQQTRSLGEARKALIGSGVVVILQFLLFLLVGSAVWAAGFAPEGVGADEIFPRFIIDHLPSGLAGLVIAGILAAAMSTIASSINALASSMTHDLYASWTGRRDPAHLFRVGRAFSVLWGGGLIGGALFFQYYARGSDTPVVVLALSIASITYGALLGTYLLAARWPRARGRDVVGAVLGTVAVMLVVVFARRLAQDADMAWLAPLGRLAWPWYVPLGTLLTFGTGAALSYLPGPRSER